MGRKKKTYDTKIRFPYEKLYRKILQDVDIELISDKDMGIRLGVSERQIRNAKFDGMDAYAADLLCVRAGYHPTEIFDDWVNMESLFSESLSNQETDLEELDSLADHGMSLEAIDSFLKKKSKA